MTRPFGHSQISEAEKQRVKLQEEEMAISAKFRGKCYLYSQNETREKWSVKFRHQKYRYFFSKKANGPFAFFSPKKNGALKNFLFFEFRPFIALPATFSYILAILWRFSWIQA